MIISLIVIIATIFVVFLLVLFIAIIRASLATRRGVNRTKNHFRFGTNKTNLKTKNDFLGARAKIWYEAQPKLFPIKKYDYNEMYLDTSLGSNFNLTKDQFKKLGISSSKQKEIEKYFNLINHFLKQTNEYYLNSFYKFFLKVPLPMQMVQVQEFYWHYYEIFLDHYLNLVNNSIYNNFLLSLLDYGVERNDGTPLQKEYDQIINNLSIQLTELFQQIQVQLTVDLSKKTRRNTYQEDDYFHQQQNDEDAKKLNEAYTQLGVTSSASDDEIKKAYKKLAVQYHPDRNKEANAKEKMQKINAAYTLIKKERNI